MIAANIAKLPELLRRPSTVGALTRGNVGGSHTRENRDEGSVGRGKIKADDIAYLVDE